MQQQQQRAVAVPQIVARRHKSDQLKRGNSCCSTWKSGPKMFVCSSFGLFVRLSVCLSVCLFVCALCSPAITTMEAPERVLANLRVGQCTWSTGFSGRKDSEEFLFTSYLVVGFSRQHPCITKTIENVAWGKQKSFQKFACETEHNLGEELNRR